jgi:tetratricopeptide (TPR) repeat protein
MSRSKGTESDRDDRDVDLSALLPALVIVLCVGALGIALYASALGIASATARAATFTKTAAGGILIAAAAFAVGAFAGFLFGIPKSRDRDGQGGKATVQSDEKTTEDARSSVSDESAGGISYLPNSNLTEISDWLTKILVGVGLIELKEIGPRLQDVADHAAKAFAIGAGDTGEPIALAIILLFLASGFFTGYLWTRLFLSRLFGRADRAANEPGRNAVAMHGLEFSHNLAADITFRGTAQAAAADLQATPLDRLRTVKDLVAWAKAQAAAGRYSLAEQAYARALSRDPSNESLRIEHAIVLSAAGRYEEAVHELRAAKPQIQDSPDLRRKNVEGLMFNYLYEDPPGGFTKAIEVGESAIKDTQLSGSATIWMYLSCAYGQQYSWWLKHPQAAALRSIDLIAVRDRAYGAAEQALARDPNLVSVMRGFLEGKDGDDDFVDFRDWEPFTTLLGVPRTP